VVFVAMIRTKGAHMKLGGTTSYGFVLVIVIKPGSLSMLL